MQFYKNKKNFILGIVVVLACLLYYYFGNVLVRTDYLNLIITYSVLFVLSIQLVLGFQNNTRVLVTLSILFRLMFLFSIPNLSQDFYRFIWDGRMLIEGINPYLYTPESFITSGHYPVAQAKELYAGMGQLNGSHFTNYPPINQLCFAVAALFAGKSILGSAMVLRAIIIIADIGTLFFGIKLLKKLEMPVNRIFWFVLNPFIIIELTGNLHFEGVMLFFLILGLYFIHQDKWRRASIAFALSISVKLIPLIFLPLLYQRLGYKKWFLFCGLTLALVIGLFAPFYSHEFVSNYASTVGLWFHNFEFNASLYYLAREIGYWFRGYNEIAIIGLIFSIMVFVVVIAISIFKNNKTDDRLLENMLWVITLYFMTTTTMHPWYLATPLILSIFTKYKFALVWSLVIILSYLAYANNNNQENLWIIALEYFIVYSMILYELFFKKSKV